MHDTARRMLVPLALGALAVALGCSSGSFTVAGDASLPSDTGAGGDTGADTGAPDACSDPTFCDGKCGTGLIDACGAKRDCAIDCGADKTCDGVTHKCVCVSVPAAQWCVGRCGLANDNCGAQVDCGDCKNGEVCMANACGCVPTPDGSLCARSGALCGPLVNDCGQTISCGVCGLGKTCNAGKCCALPSATCLGRCGTVVDDCGNPVDCGGCSGKNSCCGTTCVDLMTDFGNCGDCGATCKAIDGAGRCENGGCACLAHGTNTDVSSCGPCASGGGLDCAAGGRSKCVAGVCY